MNKKLITIITILTTLGVGYGVVLAFSPQYGINDGLVGYWTLDGRQTPWSSATAGTALDISGSGNNGTLTSMTKSTAYVRGKVGQALWFDGSADYISANSSALTYPITLSAWVKLDVIPSINNVDKIPISLANQSGIEEFWIGFNRSSGGVNQLRSVAQGGGNLRTYSITLTMDKNWHHVTAVFINSSTHVLYYDAVKQAATYGVGGTGTPTPSGINKAFISGFFYNTSTYYSPFPGLIDDARIYNRALSAVEVKQLYRMGVSGNPR
jgi:hypothetical protein